jgi:serine/threonine protein kinase/DNA-binding SARP family transcriptional activator
MGIRISTLGTMGVEKDGEILGSLPGRPVTFGLLVYLALEGSVTRDKAAAVFWPESDTERARANLSQTLYELKQELGEEWVTKRGNFLLTTESLWVDTKAFEAHLEEGRHDDAVSLYKGPFLDGAFLAQTHPFEEWVEHRRGNFRRLHRDALDGYIRDCRKSGALDKALAIASKWVGIDPLCEAGQHYLIRLLAESGNRDEAMAQFDRYAALLQGELGLEPLEETQELIRGIRSGGLKPLPRGPERIEARPASWPTSLPEGFDGDGVEVAPTDRAAFRRTVERELAPRLQILRPIGRGTMADVFLARDPALKCLVAVKFLSPEHYADEEARERFRREAQSMAQLGLHPNVCDVKWVGSLENRTPYFVMPFIRGTTLAQRLKAEGRLSPGEVRVVMLEVASALAAAHQRGIVHRDVRPDNILKEEETGKNILSDFGIAGVLETGEEQGPKLTRTGEFLGHPAYISPEQMDGKPLSDRSDIYSLGVTGYQLLTGHPPPAEEPGTGKTGKRALTALEEYAEGFSSVDRRLVELILRCLAKDPVHRPTAADIVRKLKRDERDEVRDEANVSDDINLVKILIKKRLLQILGGYVATAWMTLEFTKYLVDRTLLHPLVESLVLVTIPFGFLAVSVLGWFHGMKGRQAMPAGEKWLLAMVGVGWVVAGMLILSRQT